MNGVQSCGLIITVEAINGMKLSSAELQFILMISAERVNE